MFKFYRLFRSTKLSNSSIFSRNYVYTHRDKNNMLMGSIYLAAASTAGFAYVFNKIKYKGIEKSKLNFEKLTLTIEKYNLIDHNDNKVELSNFHGQWLIIYVGSCNKAEVAKLSMVIQQLSMDPEAQPIVPIFVSIDPTRDTPVVMKKNLMEFNDNILGLTCDTDAYSKISVDHADYANMMYLVSPKGEFVECYGKLKTEEDICKKIKFQQKQFKDEIMFLLSLK